MTIHKRIGFMQGRLSPLINGLIQSFPWPYWQEEFAIAAHHGFSLMEWTLDQARLYENPLLTSSGQAQIRELCQRYQFSIPSLTGDCFMQAPFWKKKGEESENLKQDFKVVVRACSVLGIKLIVIPLVDNGRIENIEEVTHLVAFLESQSKNLAEYGMRVVFECDFPPAKLARFMDHFDPKLFGVNYDIGNSAALGYDPAEEFRAYGNRIMNVHIKDRKLHGGTVPLGEGCADFRAVFTGLSNLGYTGNYILQTARASLGNHEEVLDNYRNRVVDWLSQ